MIHSGRCAYHLGGDCTCGAVLWPEDIPVLLPYEDPMKAPISPADMICACGHLRKKHFNGLGRCVCYVSADTVCNCSRFKKRPELVQKDGPRVGFIVTKPTPWVFGAQLKPGWPVHSENCECPTCKPTEDSN